MTELDEARLQINEADEMMAALFEKRMNAVKTIAAYKAATGRPVKDPEREAALIAKNRTFIRDAAFLPYYETFIRNVIDISCAYQETTIQAAKETGEKQ